MTDATTDRLADFVGRFDGAKKSGDSWEARCPAHEDRHASLSIGTGADGRILVHCHAGCSVVQVCQAVGAKLSDLFPSKRTSKIVAEYDYVDEHGEVLFQSVRFEPKSFRQRRPDGNGGWTWNLKGVSRVLYRLPELLAAAPEAWVYIVEGEKDVDAMRALGLTATCNPGGAGKWAHLSSDEALRGRNVAIIADNDGPGQDHARDVTARLVAKAKCVRTFSVPIGKDASDWIAAGANAESFTAMAADTKPIETTILPTDVPEFTPGRFRADLYGNADRFLHAYGRDVLWCESKQTWYVWDGRAWQSDDTRACEQKAERTIRGILKEASAADGDECMKWAVKCNKSGAARHEMLDTIKHRCPATSDQFDRAPMLLGVQNGVIDLRNGDLLPHAREHMISQMCHVVYQPDAPCPRWEQFLVEIMAGNGEMIGAIQRLVGYFLTGDVSVQILPIFYGPGGNGKNVFLDTILGIMGPHAVEAPEGLVTARQSDEHPTEIAGLCGKRLVVASETDEGRKLRIGLVKKITGNKYLTGRFMRQDYFQFERTHKTVLVTNNRPLVTETSNAIWRRLRLIPFAVTIPEKDQDVTLTEKLRAEWPGILAWAVKGCAAWWKNQCKLELPAEVTNATAEYREDNDPLGDFLSEKTVDWRDQTSQAMRTPKERIYLVYCLWCRDMGSEPLNRRAFGERVRQAGFADGQAKYQGRNQKCWWHITLSAPEGAGDGYESNR